MGLLRLLLALQTSGGLRGDKGVNVELDILAWSFVHSTVEHVRNRCDVSWRCHVRNQLIDARSESVVSSTGMLDVLATRLSECTA